MTTYLPQIDVKQVRSDHFLISSLKVFMSHQVHKLIVNLGPVAQKKGTPWCKLIEKKQTLILPHNSVISFQCLFFELNVFFKLAFIWVSDSINSLQVIFRGISQPISCRMFCNSKCFCHSSMLYMRSCAQIDKISDLINGCHASISDFSFNEMSLKSVIREQVQCLLL